MGQQALLRIKIDWRKWIGRAALVLGALTSAYAFAGLLGRLNVLFEICSHFYVQYALALLLSVVLLLTCKRWKDAVAMVPALALSLWHVLPLYVPDPSVALADAKPLKILQFNVNSANHRYDDVIAYVNRVDADVVSLEEVNAKWADALIAGLRQRYPTYVSQPQEGNFGIIFFSKQPLASGGIRFFEDIPLPVVVCRINHEGTPITIVALHVLPPMTGEMLGVRNREMSLIARELPNFGNEYVLVGDFNSSSWSPYFGDWLQQLKAKDGRKGYGVQFSWPAQMLIARTTIDHVLISPTLKCIRHEIGPDVGSDHYPVYAELVRCK